MRRREAKVWVGLLCVGSALVFVQGCSKRSEPERVGITHVTAATVPSPELKLTTDRLLAAHCNHDQLCKEFGYPAVESYEGCVTTSATVVETARQTCELGVSKDALDRCLGAIRRAPCSPVGNDLEDLPACRTSELCGSVEQRDPARSEQL